MSYTTLTLVAITGAVALDLVVLRTRLVRTRRWWLSYAILLVFQLASNGWLTGRGIVRYDEAVITGLRVAYAPIEDVGFGFALLLTVIATWVWLGERGASPTGERPSR